eukprot:TRINITY_DN4784_c0_g1_i1.p1 TRINITY_DN4784_c0_g1~~TRINITY_DN4784_c0_g1_i1.p1  ORF type:complete len:276 (-),score=72.51 TRINITY_DN4784_c0_g1_i1:778-1605(-)
MLAQLRETAGNAELALTDRAGEWKDMVETLHDEICGTVRAKSAAISAEMAQQSDSWQHRRGALVDDALASLSPEMKDKLQGLLEDADRQIKSVQAFSEEKQAAFDEYKAATEERLRQLVERLLIERIEQAFELAGDELKAELKEDEMPDIVLSVIDRSVKFWLTEISLEVQQLVLEKTRETIPGWEQGEPVHWCPNPFRKARAVLLYATLPYDRSVWGQMRDPLWWVLLVIVSTPVYGVSQVRRAMCGSDECALQAFFFLLYLLKDNEDEYVRFI